MAASQSRDTAPYPRSVGNLAIGQANYFETLLMPHNRPGEMRLGVMQDDIETQEELATDSLAPARGIVNGLRLSVTLWSLIALVVLLMR